jgi:hypothetical protein
MVGQCQRRRVADEQPLAESCDKSHYSSEQNALKFAAEHGINGVMIADRDGWVLGFCTPPALQ